MTVPSETNATACICCYMIGNLVSGKITFLHQINDT